MQEAFHTLQDFMVHSKAITYIVMGATLVVILLFWRFLSGRDERMRTY